MLKKVATVPSRWVMMKSESALVSAPFTCIWEAAFEFHQGFEVSIYFASLKFR